MNTPYNIKTKIDKGILTITVDISKKIRDAAEPSKSGKTLVIASTGAPMEIAGSDGLKFGCNVFMKNA